MLDIYESIKAVEIPKVSQSFIDRFAAWCSLNRIHKLDNTTKENFLSEILNASGSKLEKRLKQPGNPLSLVNFWRQNFENIRLEKIESKVSAEEKKEFLKYWNCAKLAEYLGIKVKDNDVTLHVISSGKQEVKFYFFHKSGSIILADISLNTSKISNLNHTKYNNVLSHDANLDDLDKRICIAKSEDFCKAPNANVCNPLSGLTK